MVALPAVEDAANEVIPPAEVVTTEFPALELSAKLSVPPTLFRTEFCAVEDIVKYVAAVELIVICALPAVALSKKVIVPLFVSAPCPLPAEEELWNSALETESTLSVASAFVE